MHNHDTIRLYYTGGAWIFNKIVQCILYQGHNPYILVDFSAFIHASGALGPVLGYALGALLLQYYVDSFTYIVSISPGHPQWIGAWWGGFIICGLLLLLLAFPFLCFPRVLLQEKRQLLETKSKMQLLSDESEQVDVNYGKTIKG